MAPLSSILGRHRLMVLLIPTILLTLVATAAAVALAMLLRHGALLLHDIEEASGPARGSGLAVAAYALVLLLPAVTLQGYGWLPLWWLTLMLLYVSRQERIVIGLLLVSCIAVGPLVQLLDREALADQNTLFRAAVQAIEGGPDSRAIAILEDANRRYPDDHDLVYLLAAQYKKAGRYEEAASLYRELLRVAPSDSYALNNLANMEFAAGEYPAAIARYKQGIETNPPAKLAATFFYNLSLAHLQRFEFQPAQAARDRADQIDGRLIRSYDSAWRYDKGDYAVVDLSLTPAELWAKFVGVSDGIALKNQVGQGGGAAKGLELVEVAATRFTGFLAVSLLVVFALSRWRGSRAFTRRCVKCGTPFCRRCQLGTAMGGLCTQCHHLFVVRDGVSGPARNRKLLEVQAEDERRDRIFRILSLLSPGSGHVYAQRPLSGIVFLLIWWFILALVLLAGRVLPYTQAAGAVERPWGLVLAGLALLALYVAANRARPETEVAMPIGRWPSGRGRAA
jgi:tetratricopeptide (TPR) repeat protein